MAQDFGTSPPITPLEEPRRRSNTTLIIVIIVLILLCCCCVAGAAGWYLWNNGDQILRDWGVTSFLLSAFV